MRFFYPLILLALFIHINCPAQKDNAAQAKSFKGYAKLDDYKKHLESIAEKNSDRLDKKLRKEYNEILSEKNTDLITEIKEDNFIFDTEINTYLSSLFYSILEKNGLNKQEYHFFVNRSSAVNAYTYEEGTVICNLGLLGIAETESQIAMVFCHELAHYLLDHGNSSIIKRIEKFNSPEFLEKVKEIKKEKYNTKKQLEDLLLSDLFNRRKHDRSQELSADSLGMLLFLKTNYGPTAVPRLFDLLNSSDTLSIKSTVRQFCDKENIAIDENWFITRKKMSFGTSVNKELKDTLKTHPDCAVRKGNALDFFNKNNKTGPDFLISTNESLQALKKQSALEEAKYSKDKDNLSYYLYQLIQMDAQFPGERAVKQEIFSLFLTIGLKQKKHELASVVEKPYATENSKDEYAKLLKMLDALDLEKMKTITNNYLEKNKPFITLTNELNNQLHQLNKN